MIDWTKPIETVPCARNPEPVPCRLAGHNRVEIMGFWMDQDGVDEQGWDWGVTENGEFNSISGSVRNVANKWGAPIPVNGKKPQWYQGEQIRWSYIDRPDDFSLFSEENNCTIRAHQWNESEWSRVGCIKVPADHPTYSALPEPTATWWARRWYDSASPDERDAMRVILAGEW